ncbi:unnamed protein product [Coregonus sp. 'balchen']|nr:unnamed protein product [Coregonus sp. 'balchen']
MLSFPRLSNHYSRMRGDVDREYLSPDLNLRHMYRLYKEKNPMAKAKFWLYWDIFTQQNNHIWPNQGLTLALNKQRKVSVLHTHDEVSKMIPQTRPKNSFNVIQMVCEDFRQLPDSVHKRPAGLHTTSLMQSHSQYEVWKSWSVCKLKHGARPQAPSLASHYPRAY